MQPDSANKNTRSWTDTSLSLSEAIVNGSDFMGADLSGADLRNARLGDVNMTRADLRNANASEADFRWAKLEGADLNAANLSAAILRHANLRGARLTGADLNRADLGEADLSGADLRNVNFELADLREAILDEADVTHADLRRAILVQTSLMNTVLVDCKVFGASVWAVKRSVGTKQQDLLITASREPAITVDDLEIAQFVYLLLHNEKIRDVIDTIGRKGVLLLGRFIEGRIAVLERLREALRQRGYVPIVFNFDKPGTKDFTETIRLLAGMSKFVIADITNPKSTPLELQATVPEIMIPFQPIIEQGQEPFAMLNDLWIKYRDWVFDPIHYSSVGALVASLDKEIIQPAEERFKALVMRKAERMGERRV
jgi:uncharacterized protein YjbI with pentapeptide repeats